MTATIDDVTVDELPPEPGTPAPADQPRTGADESAPESPSLRIAIAVAFPVLASALMVGGIFIGVDARIYAAIAGLLGVALGYTVARVAKPTLANVLIVGGIFLIGLIVVIPTGIGNIGSLQALVTKAAKSGDVLRPPVEFVAGWHAIVGWLMACVGFGAAWVALTFKKPSLALLLPLPIAAIAGISVPKTQQVGSGLAVLALFAVGLGLLSGAQSVGEGDERPPLSYELRRAAKSIPLIAVITVALYALAQTNFLVPKPYIDPTQQPQKPKPQPLSQANDRVLFEVESTVSGPWRIGSLDVYDGTDWRLPPFSESKLGNVPRSGIVDADLQPGVHARFTIAGLTGTVLPGLPDTVGIIAEGPRLSYDARNGNIRVAQGQVQAGLSYTVTAAALPSVDDLKAITADAPPDLKKFTSIPPAPPAAQALIDDAKQRFHSKWEQFDYLRTYVLDNVTAAGTGTPKSVTPARVQEMLTGAKEGSPYEIVAAQAMFARWVGLPSRIGYGFDGGEEVNGKLQVRPANGATFPEVYFPTYKWLPVIGTPKKAKPTVSNDPSQQQFDPTVLPSDDISVQLYLPVVIPPASIFYKQVERILLIVIPILLLLGALYVAWPAVRKALARSRRRSRAAELGPRTQIALAYTEWRDHATDYGFRHPTDTPLMFLDRFGEDAEHTELAWLVTRALWGDMQHELHASHAAAANELSRALRRRLSQAQPATVRAISAVSRLSLRHPFAPDLDRLLRGKEQVDAVHA
jgi:hypothetical protein